MRSSRKAVGVAAAAVSLLLGSALGEEIPLPPGDQGVVFKKILSYDRVLKRAESMTVFIVGANRDDEAIQKLVRSFRDVGIAPAVVGVEENLELRADQIVVAVKGGGVHTSEGWAPGNVIVYSMPEANLASVKQFCTGAGVLSVSGVPSLAEDGHVSVSVDKQERGQEIIVNLERLKAEKHELSAELLRLARVIR